MQARRREEEREKRGLLTGHGGIRTAQVVAVSGRNEVHYRNLRDWVILWRTQYAIDTGRFRGSQLMR